MATTTIPFRPRLQSTHRLCAPAASLPPSWVPTAQSATPRSSTPCAPWTRAHAVRDPPTEDALCVEIEKLCTATLLIDQAFYDIGRRLCEVSKEQNTRVDLYNVCHTLDTRWQQHYATYKDLIWRSREFAGDAQVAVDDFRDNVLAFLKDRRRTRAEKQDVIRAQIEMLQSRSQPSQNLCQDFLDFGRALDAYMADFARDVQSLDTADQTKNVAELKDKLQSAKSDMEVVSNQVKELGWKLATDATFAGIALLLAFVAPALWAKLPDVRTFGVDLMNVKRSLVNYLEARKRCDLAVAAYERVQGEYELESACLGQMIKLDSAFHHARPLVHDVTVKLGIFVNVWAAIKADIQKLKTSLQYADDPASPLFVVRLERLERMYGYLSQALRLYQVKVQLPRQDDTGEE